MIDNLLCIIHFFPNSLTRRPGQTLPTPPVAKQKRKAWKKMTKLKNQHEPPHILTSFSMAKLTADLNQTTTDPRHNIPTLMIGPIFVLSRLSRRRNESISPAYSQSSRAPTLQIISSKSYHISQTTGLTTTAVVPIWITLQLRVYSF